MIGQRARVVGTEAGFAVVEAAPSGGCGVSKLGKLLPRRSRGLRVPNELGARPGGLLAGALRPEDMWPTLGAGGGLLLGLATSRQLSRRGPARHAPRMASRRASVVPVVWHRAESDAPVS